MPAGFEALSSVSTVDLPFEEDVLNNRYNLKAWWRYLEFKSTARARDRNVLHERALKELPGSYKLWRHYLSERMDQVRSRPITDKFYEAVNNVFERSLVFMHKVGRLRCDAMYQLLADLTRLAVGRCLASGSCISSS